jgi:hypothetical protein
MKKLKIALIQALKRKYNPLIFVGATLLVFYFNYLLMANLPGEKDFMCVTGGGVDSVNLLFAFLMSVLVGMLTVGFIELIHQTKRSLLAAGSASSVGLIIGTLTSFCTLCTFPVITFFGTGLSMSFLTQYDFLFKFLSLISLLFALYLINKRLSRPCLRCIR